MSGTRAVLGGYVVRSSLLALLTALVATSMLVSACSNGQSGRAFVIPFSALEPAWSGWSEYEISGEAALSNTGVLPMGAESISFDSRGRQVPPTQGGSTIRFADDKYVWVNGIIIEADPSSAVVFEVVHGRGLVHIAGTGACTLPDGTRTELE